MTEAERLERFVASGGVAVFPADTVYGLACDPANPDAVRRLYALKGRPVGQPSAIMFFGLPAALQALPELGQRTRSAMAALLPGGVTLLVGNPQRRFPLAAGAGDATVLGVRVPDVPLLAGARCAVLQSSANLSGGPDPRGLHEVPEAIRAGADLVIDGGELPGTPSTIVDLRRYDSDGSWLIVRLGAVGEEELARALGGQFHFNPETYETEIRNDIPAFDELQHRLLEAGGEAAGRILDLGTGTGITARLLLERHPEASLTGIDTSAQMLGAARVALPADRVDLRVSRLQDELPEGPFDLVASALAIHHLEPAEKAGLFRRVAAVLAPEGRFVLADLVVPRDPAEARTPFTPGFDKPSSVADQLEWLDQAGLEPSVSWEEGDLAVLVARAKS